MEAVRTVQVGNEGHMGRGEAGGLERRQSQELLSGKEGGPCGWSVWGEVKEERSGPLGWEPYGFLGCPGKSPAL